MCREDNYILEAMKQELSSKKLNIYEAFTKAITDNIGMINIEWKVIEKLETKRNKKLLAFYMKVCNG